MGWWPKINLGPRWLQNVVNDHADMGEANTPLAGDGIQVADAPGGSGKIISLADPSGSAGTVEQTDLWTPTISSDGTTVTLSPGKINELMPTNMFTPISLTSGTPNYVKARCTTNGQWPTSIELVAETTPISSDGIPATGAAPDSFDVLLTVVNGAQAIQIETEPLTYIPEVVGTSSVADPEPGQDAFDRLWAWVRVTADDE